MPHNATVLLEDIRLAVMAIQEFIHGRSLADYHSDRLLRAGVERQFIIIGEALSRLDKLDASLANRLTDYRKIIGFRNILVHGYELIDDVIVWKIVQEHVPILKQQVEESLNALGKK